MFSAQKLEAPFSPKGANKAPRITIADPLRSRSESRLQDAELLFVTIGDTPSSSYRLDPFHPSPKASFSMAVLFCTLC
jgi:hypothetical protein